MHCKALVSFTGVVSMAAGEVGFISDLPIAKDLLNAGYIEEIKEKAKRKNNQKG